MSENEKRTSAGENAGSIGINEGTVHDGNVSESSRPDSSDGNDQVSIAREIKQSQKNPNPPSEAEKVEMVAAYVQQALSENLIAYDAYDLQRHSRKLL